MKESGVLSFDETTVRLSRVMLEQLCRAADLALGIVEVKHKEITPSVLISARDCVRTIVNLMESETEATVQKDTVVFSIADTDGDETLLEALHLLDTANVEHFPPEHVDSFNASLIVARSQTSPTVLSGMLSMPGVDCLNSSLRHLDKVELDAIATR